MQQLYSGVTQLYSGVTDRERTSQELRLLN